jgi:hypothetical protein
VIDKTGLIGDYDFDLKWIPDESQFARFGVGEQRGDIWELNVRIS